MRTKKSPSISRSAKTLSNTISAIFSIKWGCQPGLNLRSSQSTRRSRSNPSPDRKWTMALSGHCWAGVRAINVLSKQASASAHESIGMRQTIYAVQEFLHDEAGQDIAEYAVMLAVILL